MILKRFYDEKLAQASYLVGCAATGEALVIDAHRDVAQYLRMMIRLVKAGVDRRPDKAVVAHHLRQHDPAPPLRPCGKRWRIAAITSGRESVRATRASMN